MEQLKKSFDRAKFECYYDYFWSHDICDNYFYFVLGISFLFAILVAVFFILLLKGSSNEANY